MPSSITPGDVLDRGGLLDAFKQLQQDGIVRFTGITAIGEADALREVIGSGEFDTIQVPYNLMNPSGGQIVSPNFGEADYGNVINDAALLNMGVFAIRAYAGGVLVGNPPSRHTLTTKFFTPQLYERDQLRVAKLLRILPAESELKEIALRFVLSHPQVSSAIIGFSEPRHLDEAKRYLHAGPLSGKLCSRLRRLDYHSIEAAHTADAFSS
jgi:predicted aldo/keto reductase-like oxidoreductase